MIDLLRHAEADHNVGGEGALMGGWADVPLTERGRQQASELATRLSREPRPSALYSSTSCRALDTAAAIAERFGLPVARDERLREISCEQVDGAPIAVVRARHARAWEANAAQLDPDFRWPGGESYREFRERVVGVIGSIAAAHAGQRVIVLTHAGVISQLIGFCWSVSPARWDRHRPRNASLSRLLWRDVQGEVLRFDVELGAAGEVRVPSS